MSIVYAGKDEWNITKSTHFIVYYKSTPEDFIKQLIEKAEDYYNKISDDLGFVRYDFWLWANRAMVYIYDNAEDYQLATGQPGWSGGSAVIEKKVIQAFPYAKGFFETILPHEMGHIIFREFIGFYNYSIPLWLEEGVASNQEKSRYRMANSLIKEAVTKNKFINLKELSNLNPQFMGDPESVNLFYAEAFSVIDFLIREFGKDKFVLFCQDLRDKKNLEKALASAYSFNNVQELNDAWLKYVAR